MDQQQQQLQQQQQHPHRQPSSLTFSVASPSVTDDSQHGGVSFSSPSPSLAAAIHQQQSGPKTQLLDDPMLQQLLENIPQTTHNTTTPQGTHRDRQRRWSSPPLDWCMHNKLRLISLHSFNWITDNAHTSIQYTAITDLLQHKNNNTNNTHNNKHHNQLTTPPVPPHLINFHTALVYFIYPSSSLTPTHPLTQLVHQAQMKPTSDLTPHDRVCLWYFHQRWLDWEEAFRSVYYLLRNQQLNYFYCVSPTMQLLFVSHASVPCVLISKSTLALRTALTAAHIHFTMPHSTYSQQSDSAGHQNSSSSLPNADPADLARLEKAKPGTVRTNRSLREKRDDASMLSVLLISGRDDVHALFNWLLNQDKRTDDVPVLYARTPFAHATLESLQFNIRTQRTTTAQQNQQQKRTNSNMSSTNTAMKRSFSHMNGVLEDEDDYDATNSSAPLSYLDIRGPLLPDAQLNLFSLFNQTQQGEYTCRVFTEETHQSQAHFNTIQTVEALQKIETSSEQREQQPCVSLCKDETVHTALFAASSIALSSSRSRVCPTVARLKCTQHEFQIQLSG